jgi:hypothetical protein
LIVEEMRIGGRRADLVAVTSKGDLLAIELKVHDWSRALAQAATNLVFADFSYVGLWDGSTQRARIDEAELMGVGVILCGIEGEFRVLVSAARSSRACPLTQYEVLKDLTFAGGSASG